MLENYLNYEKINEENNDQINQYYSDNNEKEEDTCVNNKYMFSSNDEKLQNDNKINIPNPNKIEIITLDTLSSNRINYKITSEDKIRNLEINSPLEKNPIEEKEIKNYVILENLYLQDGKVNITTNNTNMSNNINFNSNEQSPIKEVKNKNEEIEKLHQILLEGKDDEEDNKIIEENNSKYNNDNNNNLIETNHIISLNNNNDNNLIKEEKEENEISENQYAEFIQKMRNNKELELKEKIKNEMRPKIFKEIYTKEYNEILENVKIEIEKELSDELNKKLNEEINYIKKRQNYFLKTKENELEKKIKDKINYELNEELNKELMLKDKELKLRYTQRYENYKKKLDKDLNTEFEKIKKKKQKEIDNIKSLIYRSKCSEKIKINKINNLKKNINFYHEENTKGVEKIDKMIINEENNFNNQNVKIHYENSNNPIEYQEKQKEEDENLKNENNFNNKDSFEEEENEKMEPEKDVNIDNYNNYSENESQMNNNISQNKISFMNNTKNNCVNLAEINNRIKFNSGRKSEKNTIKNSNENEENENIIDNDINIKNINESNIYIRNNNQNMIYSNVKNIQKNNNISNNSFSYKNLSSISNIKISTINNIIKNKSNIDLSNSENEIIEKEKIITEYIPNNFQVSQKKIISIKEISKKNNDNFEKDENNNNIFYSIQIDKNIPNSIQEFGNYLINHIEKEENYKILYQSEIKQLKTKIKKIFTQSKTTDHCLTEYMIELWDKIDISYFTRYQILKQLINLSQLNLYTFLDRETEYLTNYFQITEIIFSQIKKREKLKSKLQIKANKNELLSCDREELDHLTKNIESMINSFKQKYKGLDIIWKGIKYQSFMNYENWYYEMEQNQ